MNGLSVHHKNKFANFFINKARKYMGAVNIIEKQSTKAILQSMKKREPMSVLIDQYQLIGGRGFKLFNANTKIGTNLQKIAIREDMQIIPIFSNILPSGKTEITFFKPPAIDLNDEDASIKVTKYILECAEKAINKNPSQWFCLMHRIFR
jgi:lauroyl/myristoyl acyltransferase